MSAYRRPELWQNGYPFSAATPVPTVANQATALQWAFNLRDARVRTKASVTSGIYTYAIDVDFKLKNVPHGPQVVSSSVNQSFYFSQTGGGAALPVNGPYWDSQFPFHRNDGAERILKTATIPTSLILQYAYDLPWNGDLVTAGIITSNCIIQAADNPVGLAIDYSVHIGEDTRLTTVPGTVQPWETLLGTFSMNMGDFVIPIYMITEFNPAVITWSFDFASFIPDFFP